MVGIVWPDFITSFPSEPVNLAINEMPGPSSGVTSTKSVQTAKSSTKPFIELGPKQKRKRSSSNLSLEEQTYSYFLTLKTHGVAFILDHLLNNPEKVKHVKDFIITPRKHAISSEKALGTVVVNID